MAKYNNHVRVDDESKRRIEFLSDRLFGVKCDQGKVIEEAINSLFKSNPSILQSYLQSVKEEDHAEEISVT